MKLLALICAISLVFPACSKPEGPPGQILVRNDILDKEYNSFVVDQIRNKKGIVSFRATLKPRQKVVIPAKGVTALRFSRKYKDHTKVYVVKCPGSETDAITMKLIDVHTNRLDGGCVLTKRGKKVRGVVDWEE